MWSEEIGGKYLLTRIGRDDERIAAKSLSTTLGGLPLALEQAAAYCDRTGISISDYITRVRINLPKMLGNERDAPADYHNKRTVSQTFRIALKEAALHNSAAELLMAFVSALAPEPIPLFLFIEGRELFGSRFAALVARDELDEAIASLRDFALIYRENIPDGGDPRVTFDSIRLHRLVREVAAARYSAKRRENIRRQLIAALAAVHPKETLFADLSTWPRLRSLDAIALDLVDNKTPPAGAELQAASLLGGLGSHRFIRGRYEEAKLLYEQALVIFERIEGATSLYTANALMDLGHVLRAKGDLVGARSTFQRAIDIRKFPNSSTEELHLARSQNALGLVLRDLGELASARSLFEKALEIRKKHLGDNNSDTGQVQNNLGLILRDQGDLKAAGGYFELALSIFERVYPGMDQPNTAAALHNLATTRYLQGQYTESERSFSRAHDMRKRIFGHEHPSTVQILYELALTSKAQGKYSDARDYLKRVVLARAKVLGDSHPDTAKAVRP